MAQATNELTPMRRQYQQIKDQHKDCILMFRLGDFYEMFDEDAKLTARELDLTLTTRDRGKPKEEQTPMCGVPYHSVDSYIARLVQKGYKVAICEQSAPTPRTWPPSLAALPPVKSSATVPMWTARSLTTPFSAA